MIPHLQAKCVVVPVDVSPDSFEALIDNVEVLGHAIRVHVVHVIHVKAPRSGFHPNAPLLAQEVRATLLELLAPYGLPGLEVTVLEGRAGDALRRYAQLVGADAMLIPARSLPGARRFMLGPTAEDIVRLSPCPSFLMWGAGANHHAAGANHHAASADSARTIDPQRPLSG